jgi:small subunit ribosomal protein S18
MRPTGGGRPGGRSGPGGPGGDRGGPGGKFRRPRRRVCAFCADKIDSIDYKNTAKLRRFVSDRGKIMPRRATGNCAKHQRITMHAIKRARQVALLPFTATD